MDHIQRTELASDAPTPTSYDFSTASVVYQLRYGVNVSVIPDRRRPLRFELLVDAPGEEPYTELSTTEVEDLLARLAAIADTDPSSSEPEFWHGLRIRNELDEREGRVIL